MRFLKNYDQQGANLNNPDGNIEVLLDESNNYHQIGNEYLQYDITKKNCYYPLES